MSLFRLLACISLASLLLGLVKLSGASIGAFIDPASSIMVALGTLAVLTLAFDSHDWIAFLSFLAPWGPSPTKEELRRVVVFCRSGARATLASGAVAFLVGLITMLSDMSDVAKTISAFCVSLLPLLYAMVIAEFFFVPLSIAASCKEEVS